MNSSTCDICGSGDLIPAYKVDDGKFDLKIYVCQNCSLCQSLPRIETVGKRKKVVSTSGGAGWGNIRYGKGFRKEHNMDFLNSHLKFSKNESFKLLDIGSNRAEFFKIFIKNYPNAYLTGIEPDERLNHEYKDLDKCELINARVEDIEFGKNQFDIIYSSHTLEHLTSPSNTLTRCHDWLKGNGLIYLEVPNLQYINNDDLIDEFFIDKHLYHFSETTFRNLVLKSGFSILKTDLNDSNLSILAKKENYLNASNELTFNKQEVNLTISKIEKYSNSLKSNINKLINVSFKLNKLAKEKTVIFWGAGRIFHSLVRYGKLNKITFNWLIDSYLGKYLKEVFGVKIYSPSEIKVKHPNLKPDYVIICSKAFTSEIEYQVKSIYPSCKVIYLLDLLEE